MLQLCHVDESSYAYQFYFISDPDSSTIENFNAISGPHSTFTFKSDYSDVDGGLREDYREALSTITKDYCYFLNHSSVLNAHFIAVAVKACRAQ